MDRALLKEEVDPNLWGQYKKTPEYKSGASKAVPARHPIIINREKEGLKMIYNRFVATLFSYENAKEELVNRNIGEWQSEWKEMHGLLYKYVLKARGGWRKINVRFGSPGDEELHKIPPHEKVPYEMNLYAKMVEGFLNKKYKSHVNIIGRLAKIHYQFIRIHPFEDGNGRVARAITDQIAIFFDLPVAMVGFPRHNKKKQKDYHKAITACSTDPQCNSLSDWISGYIDIQLARLA